MHWRGLSIVYVTISNTYLFNSRMIKRAPMQPLHILVVHGPNLNLLGTREPHLYGTQTLDDITQLLNHDAERLGVTLSSVQSNHEGVLIDAIQGAFTTTNGLLINPGGLTHTSVSLHDVLVAYPHPIIEVHLSNLFKREAFRHQSYVSLAATGVICGLQGDGYRLALQGLVTLLHQ
jgi:3-dehydroquinate dehydratase II